MSLGNERGMVLLLVLVVVALLSALLSDFAFSTLIDLRLTETFRDTTRAEYLARGGITAGRMILQTDRNSYDSNNDPFELWSIGVQEYPLADGAVSVQIEDLDGRLNLNRLFNAASNSPDVVYYDRFVRLCTELALDNPESLANALIDWIDPDQEVSAGGAEDIDYLGLDPPYAATNGPLESLDELRLVKGFDAETVARLAPFVSSYGSGKLNINTAAPELLRSWDADAASTIDDLLGRREEGPYKQLEELRDILGVEGFTALDRNQDLAVTSSFYLINSRGRVNDGVRRMQAIVDKTNDKLLWQKVN